MSATKGIAEILALFCVAELSLEFCYKYVLVPLQSGPVIQNVHRDLGAHNDLFLVRKRSLWFFVLWFYRQDSHKRTRNTCSICTYLIHVIPNLFDCRHRVF